WLWERQCELLLSVRDGIPMGAVMVWRTSKEKIKSQNKLAGHVLPGPDRELPREYLLDGLQRLSTLFAALRGFGSSEAEEDVDVDVDVSVIGYDLDERAFIKLTPGEKREAVVPLSVLPNSVTLLRFQRRLKGAKADIWVERC